jgi:hypothetical protein
MLSALFMSGELTQRIEAVVDRAAAMLFATSLAFLATRFGSLQNVPTWFLALLAAAAGYAACTQILQAVHAERSQFTVAEFEVAEIPEPEPQLDELLLTEMTELVLTDTDRVGSERSVDELVLDDILAEIGPGARVVRLFDPAGMPTPGQLKSRIDQHLSGATFSSPAPDDSQALHEALAELRRSLR